MNIKTTTLLFSLMIAASACSGPKTSWTEKETDTILKQGSIMRVFTIEDPQELALLRTPCSDLSIEDLASDTYTQLSDKMIATVTSPEQDGVGIAGPQVGISRRIVAVQRFDKEGEPFEVYPNIRIIETRGEMVPGAEGCLSVPDQRGNVLRYQDITISYTSPKTKKDTTERVEGFSAVIFQHETDHLDGVLYTDKLILE